VAAVTREPDLVQVVWDDVFTRYDFGLHHPMTPVRLDLVTRLITELGLLDAPGVRVVGAEPAADEVLRLVHKPEYIEAVRAASGPQPRLLPGFGLGTEDVPVFAHMHEASARIVAGTRNVALAVWRGDTLHGVNYCGGLHHAMPASASGFCVYNDVAVAITALLDAGVQRVGYVDVDVHHRDGVERGLAGGC
jgi:acetoin utilization protein AcuC